MQRTGTLAQAVRQHLIELRQQSDGRFLHLAYTSGRRPQREGDRDGFIVVQQHRRHRRARTQLVAATETGRGAHRIAQLAQFLDVPAHRARVDLEALAQIAAGPLPARLQEGEKPQQA